MSTFDYIPRAFCGEVYMIARIWDLKSNPSIDPNLENNQKVTRVLFACENDFRALQSFSISSVAPQYKLYSGINVVVSFSATIANYR